MTGPDSDAILVAEMSSPLGVPDFVALIGGEAWLSSRVHANVAPVLSEIDCTVLSALTATRPLSMSSLVRRLGWDTEQVERSVSRLIRSSAVITTRSGAIVCAGGLKPVGSLYAIEAKVKNWQRAIIQGRGYRTWADNYVLVLGNAGPMAAERARSAVLADRAGLYTENGWVVRPRKRLASVAKRMLGFEYLYAALSSDPSLGRDK